MKEILITSSVLIGVILLARWLFRGKVSQKLIYAAWLLVALRLLVPIQFGQFQYSVTTLTEKIESQSKPIQQAQEALTAPVAGPSRAELYQQLLNEYIQQGTDHALQDVQPQITPDVQEQLEVQAEQLAAPSLSEVLTAIWIVGMSAMAGWFFTANFIFLRRAKKDAVPFTEIKTPVQVRISPNVPTPCLVGLFRPVIYLTPASIENEQSRNHVLAHELTHLRHVDHIWALVRCICLCIYWFNPLVWLAASQSRRDCELACDESALKKLGDEERIAYGHTLLSTVAQSVSPVHLIEAATAMNETKKQLKERVCFIVTKPRNIMTAMICMVLVTAIATGCTFTGGKATEPQSSESTLNGPNSSTQSTEPNLSTQPSTSIPKAAPPVTLSAEETASLKSIEALIKDYQWYNAVGACCDFEPVSQDLSQFLTVEQQAEYTAFQYLLKCCHNAQEVKSHIDSRFDPSLLTGGYPDDKLFTDDQGNLYLIVLPTEYSAYRHITLNNCSDDLFSATACRYDEDECWRCDTFSLQRTGKDFKITKIESTSTIPQTPSLAPPMSSADYHYSTIALAKEQFNLSYVEFLYAGNKIVQSVIEEYAPHNTHALDKVTHDITAMYQRILYIDHDGTARMHFPIFFMEYNNGILDGYYVREFSVPEEPYFQCNAYRWFFGELGQESHNNYTDAYASLLLDAAFQSPDLFLEYITERDDADITAYSRLMHGAFVSQAEYDLYVQLLIAISSRTDLTDREIHALELLADAPEGFKYTASPAATPSIGGSAPSAVIGADPQLPNGLITTPPSNTLSHTHVYATTTVKPTCTVKGYNYHLCHCGQYYCDGFTSATGHDYQLNVAAGAKFPTYTDTGYCTMECTGCGDRYKSNLTAGKDINFEEILAECALYAESKGYTVVKPEDWNYEQVTVREASIPAYQVYRDFTDPPVVLANRLNSMINYLHRTTYGQSYVICMELSYFSNSLGVYYGFEIKAGLPLSE